MADDQWKLKPRPTISTPSRDHPLLVCVLDGWGEAPDAEDNAIYKVRMLRAMCCRLGDTPVYTAAAQAMHGMHVYLIGHAAPYENSRGRCSAAELAQRACILATVAAMTAALHTSAHHVNLTTGQRLPAGGHTNAGRAEGNAAGAVAPGQGARHGGRTAHR